MRRIGGGPKKRVLKNSNKRVTEDEQLKFAEQKRLVELFIGYVDALLVLGNDGINILNDEITLQTRSVRKYL